MGNVLKNVAKAAVTMTVVGLLLGLAAPALGEILSSAGLIGAETLAHAQATSAAWMGAFFGMFGAIHAAAVPVYEAIADKFSNKDMTQTITEKAPTPAIVVEPTQEKPCHKFRDAVEADRATAQIVKGIS